MSDEEIRISLKQISEVLSFVKLAFGIAVTAVVFLAGVLVWVKLTDQTLQAHGVELEKMSKAIPEIQQSNRDNRFLIENQQKQLDKLTVLIEKQMAK